MKKIKYFSGYKYTWNEKENLYFYENEYGSKFYRNENGKRHNENGPAIEWNNGYKEYYINDKHLTEEEFLQYKRNQNLKHNLERILK